jgi:heptosyltransferase-2
MAPGSSDPDKNWPPGRFAQLARWAVGQGWTVWLIGAAHEARLVEEIRARAGDGVHAATDASLATSTARLAAADMFVGNDSGPFHIAAALGKPSVGIFTFSRPFLAAPINANARVVVAPYRLPRASFTAPQHPAVEAVVAMLEEAMRTVGGSAG